MYKNYWFKRKQIRIHKLRPALESWFEFLRDGTERRPAPFETARVKFKKFVDPFEAMFEENNVFNKAKLDLEFAEKLRKESPTQFSTLIKMHLSFLLDLNESVNKLI